MSESQVRCNRCKVWTDIQYVEKGICYWCQCENLQNRIKHLKDEIPKLAEDILNTFTSTKSCPEHIDENEELKARIEQLKEENEGLRNDLMVMHNEWVKIMADWVNEKDEKIEQLEGRIKKEINLLKKSSAERIIIVGCMTFVIFIICVVLPIVIPLLFE